MSSSSTLDFRDRFMEIVFLICTATSIVAVALISWFVFSNSIPAIAEVGFTDFIFGTKWAPGAGEWGILPMILGSIYVTIGAAILGVPIGVLTAIFMAFYCPKNIKGIFQSGINLLAGIPSIVYGLWALKVVVPLIRVQFGGFGLSLLAAIILLGIMILPTVISLSQSALESVPDAYYQGAIGLGATHERAVFSVVLPAASSGVLSSIIMGIGRAIGETMAVTMVIGNSPIMPSGLTNQARTLTTNIVTEMAYAGGLHRELLIATGAALFIFILVINVAFNVVKNKEKK